MKSKVPFALCIVAILILITLCLYKSNSFYFSIKQIGSNPKGVKVLRTGTNMNNNEFRIIAMETKNKNIVLAMAEKNKFGFWKILYTSPDVKLIENNIIKQPIEIGWCTPLLQTNGVYVKPKIQIHLLYYGKNAIKPIKFSENQIPSNMKVEIEQTGSEYAIYITSEESVNIDMRKILIDSKFIED